MKSLDEVIKKIEKQWVCPSSDEADEYCELYDVRDDVLHYLKEYRDDRENFSEAISNCGKALNKYIMEINTLAQQEENLPLTWDELRKMADKPVWWKHGEVGEWLTIYRVPTLGNGNDNVIYATTCSGVECWIWRKDLDKFQYYRKERE